VRPLFSKLVALFGYGLTFEQLIEVAKPYAPEVGFDVSTVSKTIIHNGFHLAMIGQSLFHEDENGVVKLLKIDDGPKPAKTDGPPLVVKQFLIESDDGWEEAVLEVIRDEDSIFTEGIQESIRDNGGSPSWLAPSQLGEDEIEDQVSKAIDRLGNENRIKYSPEEGGWVINEQ
jgi:hypothetical protein